MFHWLDEASKIILETYSALALLYSSYLSVLLNRWFLLYYEDGNWNPLNAFLLIQWIRMNTLNKFHLRFVIEHIWSHKWYRRCFARSKVLRNTHLLTGWSYSRSLLSYDVVTLTMRVNFWSWLAFLSVLYSLLEMIDFKGVLGNTMRISSIARTLLLLSSVSFCFMWLRLKFAKRQTICQHRGFWLHFSITKDILFVDYRYHDRLTFRLFIWISI